MALRAAAGLADRSSRPHRSPNRLPAAVEGEIEALRRERLTGPRSPGVSDGPSRRSARCCAGRALGRLAALDPRPPVMRYERDARRADPHRHQEPGQDRRRRPSHHRRSHRQSNRRAAARASVRSICTSPSMTPRAWPTPRSCPAWARRTPPASSTAAWPGTRRLGVDGRARDDRQRLGLSQSHVRQRPARSRRRHIRTRPYTPRTNGKAERFIQTSLREWAYATPFNSSAERHAAMHPWLHDYNTARPHAALAGKPPITRLNRDNVLGSDT